MALGGKNKVLPDTLQAVAQIFLTDGVASGCVHKVDTLGQEPMHKLSGAFGIDALDGDAPAAQTGDPQAGFAQSSVFHFWLSSQFPAFFKGRNDAVHGGGPQTFFLQYTYPLDGAAAGGADRILQLAWVLACGQH